MYFKKIDIQGFKSFAEPVSIEFHDGITCIVGPNGSGKSNISDAVRWVLGEQSPKMLRGGRMEEIIFAGTANRKSKGMAEVTLIIDNSKNILPIEYSEVAISRRMYRSGESEYSINKVPCRLRDIRDLIMDTGIGVDGYSIIGQGKIADLISGRPDSRREIFEEAAGIVKYRNRKEEAERKLEAGKNNLDRVNDIIGEIESRLDSLKEESKKAAEYIALRDKYKGLQINITLKNVEGNERKNKYIKEDMAQLSKQIELTAAEKAAADKEASTNREKSLELNLSGDEIRGQLAALTEDINSLYSERQICNERLQNIKNNRERLIEELEALARKRAQEEKNRKQLSTNKESIAQKLKDLEEEFRQKSREYSLLLKELEEAEKILSDNKDRIYEAHGIISAKKAEIGSLTALRNNLVARKKHILLQKENSHTEGDLSFEECEKEVFALEALKNSLSEKKQEIRKAKEEHDSVAAKEKELRKKEEDLRIRLGQASARKKMIEDMESAYEGYNHGVRYLMKSEFSGIHGVVADLIEVPAGFEIAIETALGSALQNIICSEDKDARIAIDALKKDKAGRLTFLPISDIRAYPIDRNKGFAGEEGFKGFAVDCIRFNDKYRNVMEYLLGRVLVVGKLEDAIRLSKSSRGNLRFVTLEGEIVNAGGAITGGAFRSGATGLLRRKTEVLALRKTLSSLRKELKENTFMLNVAQNDLKKASDNMKVQEDAFRETERKILIQEGLTRQLSERLEGIKNAKDRWDKELLSIEEEERSAAFMIETLKSDAEDAETEINMAELLGEEASRSADDKKASVAEKEEDITKVRLALEAAKSEENSLNRLLGRIENSDKEYADEEISKKRQQKQLDLEEETLKEKALDLQTVLADNDKKREDVRRRLQNTVAGLESILHHTDETEKKREELGSVLSGYQMQKHELSMKLTRNETQIESLRERLWEDFEMSYLQAMDFRDKEFSMAAAMRDSREIKNRMQELGEVNIGAIKEYESVKERYEFLTGQRDDLLSAADSLLGIIEEMDKTIRKNFRESFDQILVNFSHAFRALFGGGAALLRLEDESKPLETGIEIVAQPPGKKLQNINLLSGGEKALTAIALMFAMLRTKPTPFCILDEVETALDDTNISRFAEYLKEFQTIQFVLVTHQKATMEYADILYGVTMPEQGISKVISLKLGDEFEF